MKAVVYTRYGGPEVLQLKEVEKPSPGDGEVMVKVHAVSLNDWGLGENGWQFIVQPFNLWLSETQTSNSWF